VCVQCGGAVERPSLNRHSNQAHLLMGAFMGLTLMLGLGLTLVDASETGMASGSRQAPPSPEQTQAEAR